MPSCAKKHMKKQYTIQYKEAILSYTGIWRKQQEFLLLYTETLTDPLYRDVNWCLGAIWVKQPVLFDWWEVELIFRVTGRGRIGADGLAFWYTSSKGAYNGTVFGSSDMWNGLGIFFDSFDNDNKHNNPYIMAVLNDGTKTFDHTKWITSLTVPLLACVKASTKWPFYFDTVTVLRNCPLVACETFATNRLLLEQKSSTTKIR